MGTRDRDACDGATLRRSIRGYSVDKASTSMVCGECDRGIRNGQYRYMGSDREADLEVSPVYSCRASKRRFANGGVHFHQCFQHHFGGQTSENGPSFLSSLCVL